MDLDPASREALELDEVLSWLSGFARTALGAARLAALRPLADGEAIAEELATVREVLEALELEGAFVPSGLPSPAPALERLPLAGARLDGRAARDLALVVVAAGELGRRLHGLGPALFPRLGALGAGLPDLGAETAAVLAGTDGAGALVDQASPELARLRGRAARVKVLLRRLLERYVREARDVIRDDFVTERNGRFVVPVRSDAARAVRGIVHGGSSSGASRFVEPLETVESNNELVRLAEEEREEEERILAQWTDDFRRRAPDVARLVELLARTDALQAKAHFARAADATLAAVGQSPRLSLSGLRHPLLQRRLVERGDHCVPTTVELDPADRVLVLSGPNAGGKTVALKAIGLAVLMAQCGIPVTAHAAELPVFRQLRADIGDHQSIAADLSTFSAHLAALAAALQALAPPALLLFDEIGTGTEPSEGGALAQAILESLVRPQVTVVATTHLLPLKTWAATTEGARTAAMDVDPLTLAPSYRFVPGAAGRSLGLDIAERLRLDPAVVERARGLVDPARAESEARLARLRETLEETAAELERARGERETLERDRERLAHEAARAAEARHREAAAALERELADFRRAARAELDAIAESAVAERARRRAARAEQRLAVSRARAESRLAMPGTPPAPQAPLAPERAAPGLRVGVRSLGCLGVIERLEGAAAAVRVGALVVRVPLSELEVPAAAAPRRRAEGGGARAGRLTRAVLGAGVSAGAGARGPARRAGARRARPLPRCGAPRGPRGGARGSRARHRAAARRRAVLPARAPGRARAAGGSRRGRGRRRDDRHAGLGRPRDLASRARTGRASSRRSPRAPASRPGWARAAACESDRSARRVRRGGGSGRPGRGRS